MKRDPYSVLNVDSDSSSEEIKKAYQRLALEFHPDKSKQTPEKFTEISEAYALLSDPERRLQYDSEQRQSSYDESPIVFESVRESELTCEGGQRFFTCRCGGSFEVPEDCDSEFIACSDCSLVIKLERDGS